MQKNAADCSTATEMRLNNASIENLVRRETNQRLDQILTPVL